MSTHLPIGKPVGKKVANWNPNFANWIQLADPCQLENKENHEVMFSWQLAVPTEFANLPTEPTRCFCCSSLGIPVGEISPSYYVGEGTEVPSPVRREVPARFFSTSYPENTTCLLALDLGTQTGWALRSRDGSIISGSESFRPGRFEGGGMRFLRFKRWLTEIKQSVDGIDAVYFEEVRRHAGVDAAHAYGGFMAHLTAWCEHHQIPYQGVPVGTIKKAATGKGNAGKDAMIAAARARGFAPQDDNEADALALLAWAVDQEDVA